MHYDRCSKTFNVFLVGTMIDRLDSELSTIRTAMNLRAYRQEVLASNIANADTPQYKARDFDFATTLGNVMAGKGGGALQMNQTSMRHIQGEPGAPYNADLKYRSEYQGAVDGNTVNMDIERADFAENALQFETLITVVRTRLGDLRTALQATS